MVSLLNGAALTDLAIDTLFDINSIVSSVLHLVLLQEVPIVQNHQELESLLRTARGKQDVIFSKVMAIGTPEHRAFMEAAFAYGHRYKFLVTTSVRNVLKESDAELWDETIVGVWLFQCKQTLPHEDCPRKTYRGILRVNEFPTFMKALDMPLISKIENGGSSLHMDLKIPTVILVTKLERFPKGEEAIAEVADEYLGSVGFVIVDVNFVDTATIPSLRIDAFFRQSDIPFLVMHPGRSENS
ncbi:thioredoxin domain-containing protein 16-like [Anneissia japonica]|uniref:thioredoxin domain-containing protein 16-like n=1 Tax=Anneissia japonica TaxID=1529436 RepID=UPI001425A0D7|nr:thioredoxin domain-containing protein 16-like [Anneissia japonica]